MAIETISNVSPFLGDNDQFSLVIEGTSGDTFAKGSLLVYNPLTGRMKAYSGASTEKPSAMVVNAFTMPAAGYVTKKVAVAGEFNGAALSLPGSVTLDTVLASSASAIAITADAGNTGDGTAGAITQGSLAKPGTYEVNCITATVDSAAASVAIAPDAGNTGDGAAGAITAGSLLITGTYVITCVEAVVDGGRFSVVDPNGDRLADLTVGVAYDTDHFDVTISDGAADFVVGDFFVVTATAAVSAVAGTFEVLDPDNNSLANLTVGVAYDNGHFAVTISDGATNFVVGDKFTVVPQVYADGSLRMMLKENGLIVRDVTQMYE